MSLENQEISPIEATVNNLRQVLEHSDYLGSASMTIDSKDLRVLVEGYDLLRAYPPHPAENHEPGIYIIDKGNGNPVAERVLTIDEYNLLQDTLKKIISSNWHNNPFSKQSLLLKQISAALKVYKKQAQDAVLKRKSFQEDVLLYFRSLALMLQSVGNAGTHAEKDARLRGVIGLLEGAIQNVRDDRESLANHHFSNPDIFRSDYPERRYLERIRELEAKLAKLDPEGTKSNELVAVTETYSDIPF